MAAFSSRDIDILVSTTVIEVGIDIPEASLMVIEHAERFGLSQLHQLRGRVGRGAKASYCILMTDFKKTETATRRLRVMEQTNDGFKIAEEDLRIRGPGDLMGIRQSGLPDFRVANILRDGRLLHEARTEAFALVESDPGPVQARAQAPQGSPDHGGGGASSSWPKPAEIRLCVLDDVWAGA